MMKHLQLRITLLAAVTLILFTAARSDEAPATETASAIQAQEDGGINVISFNIRYDNPDDGENAWPNRIDMVAGVIRFHGADFAGLQEALHHQIEDLEERLPEYEWIGVGRSDGATAGEYTPIFYRADRFELLEQGTFWLSETPEDPGSKSWDAAIERIATWGHFRDRATDRRFILLNTHFDHVGREARAESARLIVERLASIEPDLPRIVTGDFNTTDDTDAYQVLTAAESGLRDAFRATEQAHYGPTSTWNGFSSIAPDRRIDFIFVGEDVTVRRHGILAEQLDGRFPSDHLPVLAEVTLD